MQVVEQLREALKLTGEELRKHTAFKPNFCGYACCSSLLPCIHAADDVECECRRKGGPFLGKEIRWCNPLPLA